MSKDATNLFDFSSDENLQQVPAALQRALAIVQEFAPNVQIFVTTPSQVSNRSGLFTLGCGDSLSVRQAIRDWLVVTDELAQENLYKIFSNRQGDSNEGDKDED